MNTYCGIDSGIDLDISSEVKPVIGGVTDYNRLSNKPSINGIVLEGDKSNEEINIGAITNSEIEEILKQFV